MIFILISHDKSTIILSRVNATNNYFSSNGGGIYIFGIYFPNDLSVVLSGFIFQK